ncbi:hypothetical protein GOV14_03990 [Candidatus Pacearchaeota archaeon]|nr:hypothetical protein [Candidatus Pacearchaeota archaeon]
MKIIDKYLDSKVHKKYEKFRRAGRHLANVIMAIPLIYFGAVANNNATKSDLSKDAQSIVRVSRIKDEYTNLAIHDLFMKNPNAVDEFFDSYKNRRILNRVFLEPRQSQVDSDKEKKKSEKGLEKIAKENNYRIKIDDKVYFSGEKMSSDLFHLKEFDLIYDDHHGHLYELEEKENKLVKVIDGVKQICLSNGSSNGFYFIHYDHVFNKKKTGEVVQVTKKPGIEELCQVPGSNAIIGRGDDDFVIFGDERVEFLLKSMQGGRFDICDTENLIYDPESDTLCVSTENEIHVARRIKDGISHEILDPNEGVRSFMLYDHKKCNHENQDNQVKKKCLAVITDNDKVFTYNFVTGINSSVHLVRSEIFDAGGMRDFVKNSNENYPELSTNWFKESVYEQLKTDLVKRSLETDFSELVEKITNEALENQTLTSLETRSH